jgi:hypothetical protein
MQRMFVITLMGMAIVGGGGIQAIAGETKAANAVTEEAKGNKTKAEMERAKGKAKGAGERVKGNTKELKARVE